MSAAARLAPRVLNRQHAARYCGHTSLEEFARWAKQVGLRTVPGRRGSFYDRAQIDDALDQLMGITNTPTAEQAAADAWFERRKMAGE